MPVKMSNSLWNIENKKNKIMKICKCKCKCKCLWGCQFPMKHRDQKKKIWRVVNVNVNVNVKFSMKHRDCQILYET